MNNNLMLLCTIFFISIVQSQQTDLQLILETGKEYFQKINSKIDINQDVNGQEISMKMVIKSKMIFLVKSYQNHTYELDVKYDSLSMFMDLPQGKISFGTHEQQSENMVSKMMMLIINKPFQLKMTDKGKILEINAIQIIFENAMDQFPEVSEAELNQIKKQLMEAYGAKAFKGSIEMISSIFPEKPVNIGESWTNHTKLESAMSTNVNTTYSFKESAINYNLIEGDSKIATEDKNAETNLLPMNYDLSGTMISSIKIDKKSGWVIEAQMAQQIKGDAHVKPSDQLPDGMKIPMTMISDTKITN